MESVNLTDKLVEYYNGEKTRNQIVKELGVIADLIARDASDGNVVHFYSLGKFRKVSKRVMGYSKDGGRKDYGVVSYLSVRQFKNCKEKLNERK